MTHLLDFPPTENPLVSILLPTRKRPDWLLKSVNSLHKQAARPEKLEYLFRVDSDDLVTIEECRGLCQNTLPNARLLVEPRGRGYLDMHLWITALARMARGDWLIIWNDDALMQASQWDDILAHAGASCDHSCSDIFMFLIPSVGRPGCSEFMFLRRKVVEILGHWALSPHNDNWITRVMEGCKSLAFLPAIQVNHLSHKMEDKTREESVAAYAEGGLARETLESEWAQQAIKEDIEKLNVYLAKYRADEKVDEEA